MEILVAILHIVGAVIATMVLGTTLFLMGAWVQSRSTKRELEEASLFLEVPLGDLEEDDPALRPKIIHYAASKFSNELFRNRISDLLGTVLTAWNWVGLVAEIAVLAWVAWIAFSDSAGHAIYAWTIIVVALFVSLVSAAVVFACRVLTGRYPGQARQVRKQLASTINTPQII